MAPATFKCRSIEKSAMVIASGVTVAYLTALTQRYIVAQGRIVHLTEEQLNWLESLRPTVLSAEKQRAFQESMKVELGQYESAQNPCNTEAS